ncbi:uncharacterized protein LOC124160737 [Ischnura elegans]|uniref:uncharacterized protein LOC124160737 n=1 Tax=Ischnura elegans TaxID=197161 RepID=UPI001ED8957F|nr:uncharacterized protein LOC124160737 [Ischnura elegans]
MISNIVVVNKPNLSGRNCLLVDLEQLKKEEFAQRRKLRIQQVRLQSKDLASRVLRDVRNERKSHLKEVQHKPPNVCNKWQSRKLLEINLMYKENNPGQRAAAELPDPEEEIQEQMKKNEEAAQQRGRKAVAQLKSNIVASRQERDKALSQREKAKTLESIRATMVSALPNIKSKRNPEQNHSKAGENVRGFVNDPETPPVCTGREESEDHVESQRTPVVPELRLPVSATERQGIKLPETSSRKTLPATETLPHLVEVYDHHNPCSLTQRQHPSVRVEKTSILSQTNAREAAERESKEEAERQTVGVEAEEEARITRGKKALAKELIRRDFSRVMNHFDELARQDCKARVAEISKLPPEIYMDEERAACVKKKQQQDMESAFEGVMHGNMGVELGKERSKGDKSEDTGCEPLLVEKASFPEDITLDATDPMTDTSIPKLNLAVCEQVSTSTSTEYDASSSSSHPTINSSDVLSDKTKNADEPIEITPVEKIEEKPCERQSAEDIDRELQAAREELRRRIENARSILEENGSERVKSDRCRKEGDEVDHKPSSEPDKGKVAWWCTLSQGKTKTQVLPLETVEKEKPKEGKSETEKTEKEKSKSKRKSSVYKNSFEVKGKTLEEVDILLQKAKKDRESRDSNGTVSSNSTSSWGLEEVRVVFKVDEESSEKDTTGVEEEGSSRPTVTLQKAPEHHKSRGERVKWVAGDKKETKPKQVEDKHLGRQERRSVKFLDDKVSRKRKERWDNVADQTARADKDLNIMADRKKSGRKGEKALRTDLDRTQSDTSCARLPTDQEIMDSDRAKLILEEVKSQRKRLEKWVEEQRNARGKGNRLLLNYIQKLLSMSRESVAELSVSDVSSPVVLLSTPSISDSSAAAEVVEDPSAVKKCEDKGVGTSFEDAVVDQEVQVTLSPCRDERTISPASTVDGRTIRKVSPVVDRHIISRTEESDKSLRLSLDRDIAKSLAELKSSVMPPRSDPSVPVRELQSPVQLIPHVPSIPPSPPPPSPEYDELSVLHSKRISLLGAKLEEIREMRKRLMTSFQSSNSDSEFSASLSPKSGDEDAANVTKRSDSVKEGERSDVPEYQAKGSEVHLGESDGRESLDSSRSSGRSDEESEDSLLEKLFLDSLTLSEPKKSFKPSEEVKSTLRNGNAKAGPPPTALKGGTWIGSEFQIPHELSTIAEVDSRLFSATSLAGQKKGEEYSTSVISTQHQQEPLEDPFKESEVLKAIGIRSPVLFLEKVPVGSLAEDKESVTDVAEKPSSDISIVLKDSAEARILTDRTKSPKQDVVEEEDKSDVSLPLSFSSLDNSAEFPCNLDDALRILGISPSILKRRISSESGNASSATSSQSGSPGKKSRSASVSPVSSPPKDDRRTSPTVGGSSPTIVAERELKGMAGDSELQKSSLQFTPLGSFKDLCIGTSSAKSQQSGDQSVGRGGFLKEMGLEPADFQSTPIASFKEFTYSHGSGSFFLPEHQPGTGSILPPGAFRNMGKSFPELTLLKEKLSPGVDRSHVESPAVPKGTPELMLKHSTPKHSFSGDGSSSSNSGEQRSRGARSGFPFIGDSAPSSISGGNTSDGTEWKNLSDDNQRTPH